MAIGQNFEFNNPNYYSYGKPFRGKTATVNEESKSETKTSEKTEPDTFVGKIEKEKNKLSTKKALAAGGAVFTIAGLITILNPKNSSKLLQKIKVLQAKNKIKLDNSKQNFLKTKFGQFLDKTFDVSSRAILATGNFNNGKDILYKNICSKKRQFNGVKNESLRNGLRKANDVFTNFMTSVNNKITKGFDSVSKSTVRGKYKKASKSLNNFETSIKDLKSKLPIEQQRLVDEKLAEIAKSREFFIDSNLNKRFNIQEQGMKDLNLEEEVTKKITSFFNGYKGQKNIRGAWEHTDKNLTLWSEDILKPHRELLQREGDAAVSKLFGGENGVKGLYDEILDITKPHLSIEDQKLLTDARKSSAKKLRKANKNECIDYYDKKRDLVLGGAPTDILTGVLGLGAASIGMLRADTKEERKAKLFGNSAFPLIPTALGIGVSVAMTAMLFSGATGLMVGFGVTTLLSKLGSLANKYLLGYDEDAAHEAKVQARKEKKAAQEAQKLQEKQNVQNPQEAMNV